jgi:hypothetical protein
VEHCPPFADAASYRVKFETQADPLSDLHQVFLSEIEQRNPGGALFNFYNKWIDATGVSDMTASAYAVSGERLSTFGYLPPETSAEHE